ncbi:MAG TPA: methyltransferase domain-containing protein [Candidatus Binataceae bacterium]|nr:methyltransferase domain-containing protein [Candidatus Binataceae bacterium]
MASAHQQTVQREFAKQARSLAGSPVHRDPNRLRELVELSGVQAGARVLDLACGPGLVAQAFAAITGRVIGLDLTEGMLREAGERARFPVALVRGDAEQIPLLSGTMDLGVMRYTVHHLPRPKVVVGELARVLKAGGRAVILDEICSDDPVKAAYHNRIEWLRDPSHVRALSAAELLQVCRDVGLRVEKAQPGNLDMDFEEWSSRTFQSAERIAQAADLMRGCLGRDDADLGVRMVDGKLHFRLRTLTVLARKA